jgi:hypothetical protein
MKRFAILCCVVVLSLSSLARADDPPLTPPVLPQLEMQGDGTPGSVIKAVITGAIPEHMAFLAMSLQKGSTNLIKGYKLTLSNPNFLLMGKVDANGKETVKIPLPKGLPVFLNGLTFYSQAVTFGLVYPTSGPPVPEYVIELTNRAEFVLVVPAE